MEADPDGRTSGFGPGRCGKRDRCRCGSCQSISPSDEGGDEGVACNLEDATSGLLRRIAKDPLVLLEYERRRLATCFANELGRPDHVSYEEGHRAAREGRFGLAPDLRQRPKRWKIGGQASCHELVDALVAIEVLELVLTEIAELDSRVLHLVDQARCRPRGEHLAAMTNGTDASRAVHAEPDVTVVRELWLTRVHANSDAYISAFGPDLVVVRTLNHDRSRDSVLRSTEGEEEPLALGVHLPSAVLFKGVSHEFPVSREQTGVVSS